MRENRPHCVYRVCAGAANRWDVFEGRRREPVASFDERGAALCYATSLARGTVSWQLLLSRCTQTTRHRGRRVRRH